MARQFTQKDLLTGVVNTSLLVRNRFNLLGNPNLEVKPRKVDAPIEEFPALGSCIKKVPTEQKYMDALHKKDDTKSESEYQLFLDENIVLRYDNIIRMYNDFGIYRIRMQYLLTNSKLHILDSLFMLDSEKGACLKEKINYDKIAQQNTTTRMVIKFYNIFTYILENLEILKNINEQYGANTAAFKSSLEMIDIDQIFNIINGVQDYIGDTFYKYSDTIYEVCRYFEMLRESLNCNNLDETINFVSQLIKNIQEIDTNIKHMIQEHDPRIDCQYYVDISNTKENIFSPLALSTSLYLDCTTPITVETDNINLDDDLLLSLNETRFDQIFASKKFNNNAEHFVKLHTKQNNINIRYRILEQIPNKNFTVRIVGLPHGSSFLSSMIRNEKIDIDLTFLPIYRLSFLLKRNKKQQMTKSEYTALPTSVKNKYSYNNTNLNMFVADYLFNHLLKNDDTTMIIKPDMLDSFRTLAERTSKNHIA